MPKTAAPKKTAAQKTTSAPKKGHHVVPRDNGWCVIRAGATRASGIYRTREEAVRRAQEIVRHQGTTLYIHGTDGRIRERHPFVPEAAPAT